MHRAVGCSQGWKFGNYLVGLSRNPWVGLSDGTGSFIQGTSCLKSGVSRMKTKFFYPVESVVFKASVPVSRSKSAAAIAEKRRIVSTASLQTGRTGKLADRKASGGRYLSSKRLIESAFRVLLDLRNQKISIGLFRLGRSASSENSVLTSAHADRHSAGPEFEWSSALWEAEILNAAEDETLSSGIPVNSEVNPVDKSLDSTRETENGFHAAVDVVNGARGTSLCNALEAEIIDRETKTIAAVNWEPADSSVLDTHGTTAQGSEMQKKDTGAESRDISEHHLKSSSSANSTGIEQSVEEVVQSSSRDPSEDSGQAYPIETNEESVVQSDMPAVGHTGGKEMEEKLENLKKLREAVAHHAYRYYTLDDPIISDSAYDALVKEMKQVEASTVGPHDSGSLMVGAPPSPRMLKVQHIVPMLSLASVQKEDELVSWHQRLEQRLGTKREPVEWVVEPKVDGLALSLRYENGKLVCASTRGNGFEGEDVTHNAQNVQNIPLEIPQQLPGSVSRISSIDVRGEIYMPLIEFQELNTLKLRAEEKPFANPRNAAAGSMRLLSSQNFDDRRLKFVAYNIANIALAESEREVSVTSPQAPVNQWEALQLLKSLGFFVNEDNQIFDSFDYALDYAKRWMTKRQSLGYEADGVVFKVNDRQAQALLGSIGGNPRWAVAWKFAGTEVVTVLEAIELTVGRTGVIVPNARLKPVELGGVLLRRASLHNFRHVKNLGLCEGDHVIVRRAGDVIPQIVQPVEESRLSGARPWVPPSQCPSCGSELKEEPLKAMVFCRNSSCSSRRSRQVEHYAKTLIDGLGPKILTQLQEEGLVVDVADLYSLNEAALSGLPRFGTKSARKLLSAIQESKSKPHWEFIAALGIPRVGIGIAQRLDEHLGGLQGLLNASDGQLLSVPGVGEQTLKSVFDWCRCETNIGLVSELLAAGCAHASSQLTARETQVRKSVETAVSSYIAGPDSLESAGADQPERSAERLATAESSEESRTTTDIASKPKLLGKSVVVTGSFVQGDREYMHDLVRSHGGNVRSSVTSKTSFVLSGANPGPNKIVACKQLGIEVLDWEKFQHLVQGP